ncbi:SAUR family protein [Marchantia polymorpha subsp. ruderalis]|nr:hypothetical protein MARPO_0034s0006 [Marchantia polymorpha]BBN13633.1 hypothetical protein Mp_6g05120 [Marchantia polymorpha subsp. ruderalis]|eukprot:PTQ41396.1 hypothetical protein MARPO_0034s0006 [Marchantia polymorpha]
MATPVLKRSSRISKSCNMSANMAHGGGSGGGNSCSSSSSSSGDDGATERVESRRSKKQQFFSRGLSLSNFSRSFVTLQTSLTRIAHLSPHSHSHSAPASPRSVDASSACSTPSSVCSTSSTTSSSSGGASTPTTASTPRRPLLHHAKRPTCVVFGRRRGHSKRSKSLVARAVDGATALDERRPVLLEKVPSGKSADEYLTVYVGIKRTQRVKYVISRDLLSHQLFQVLIKCSEDEFGQDYTTKGGIAIICDPALFLHIVKVVDDSLRATEARAAHDAELEESAFDSE